MVYGAYGRIKNIDHTKWKNGSCVHLCSMPLVPLDWTDYELSPFVLNQQLFCWQRHLAPTPGEIWRPWGVGWSPVERSHGSNLHHFHLVLVRAGHYLNLFLLAFHYQGSLLRYVKNTIKVCVSSFLRQPVTCTHSASHLKVCLYLCNSGSIVNGEVCERRSVNLKSPSKGWD